MNNKWYICKGLVVSDKNIVEKTTTFLEPFYYSRDLLMELIATL